MRWGHFFILLVVFVLGCKGGGVESKLPNGYKIWIMNSEEVYISDAKNELLVGPSLKKVGVTDNHIVAVSDVATDGYIGNLQTSGYSLIDRRTNKITTKLTEEDAKVMLSKEGEEMPALLNFNEYTVISQ